MKVVFIGAVEFSRRALARLIELRADVAGVCTLKESGFNADHADLSDLCRGHGIPWIYAADINSAEALQWMANRKPDVIFCFGWSRLLRENLLQLAPMGVVGFHATALPANRGRHPIIWSLVLGLPETAATFFFMDAGADSGDILSQCRIRIDDADDAASLYEKVTVCALEQIAEFVPQLASRSFPRLVQDGSQANLWRKRGKADGQIDWRMSACSIYNLVRGLTRPYVGSHFLYRGQEIKVWKSEVVTDVPPNLEPGKILAMAAQGVLVKCGEHGLRLLETEPVFSPIIGEYL